MHWSTDRRVCSARPSRFGEHFVTRTDLLCLVTGGCDLAYLTWLDTDLQVHTHTHTRTLTNPHSASAEVTYI